MNRKSEIENQRSRRLGHKAARRAIYAAKHRAGQATAAAVDSTMPVFTVKPCGKTICTAELRYTIVDCIGCVHRIRTEK